MAYQGKLVVVDDEYTNRFLLETILEEYTILSAESGQEMREILKKEKPNLILLDIMMPGEDGFEIGQKLAKDENYKDIPFIYLSAKDSPEVIKKGFEIGASDYIKKPFNQDELKVRIQAVIQRNKLEIALRGALKKGESTDGLNDINYFLKMLGQQIAFIERSKKSLSIAVINIDFLEKIKNIYGEGIREKALKELISIIDKNIREYDIVSCYDGNKLVLMFLECTKIMVKKILERMNFKLESFENKDNLIYLSSGVAEVKEIDNNKIKKEIKAEKLLEVASSRLIKAGVSKGEKIIID